MAALNLGIPGLGNMGLNLGGLPMGGFNSSAMSGFDQTGASFSGSGAGDWNVNLGGSGFANQTATSGINWLLIAAAVGAAWFVLRK